MECPHIPLSPPEEFARRIGEKASREHIPLSGSIEITYRCNLRCVHCFINTSASDDRAREQELTTREWCGILGQMVEEGCLWLLLTGGEPLLRPDFLDIYTCARERGILVTLFTNGTLITPRIADHLAEWTPSCVEITLYGVTPAVYERVTGVPGSFERCMHGIELLREREVPLKLKTMVLTLNRDELEAMKRFAEGMGLDFRFDAVLNLRADGGNRPAQFRIPAEEVVQLDLADEKRMKEWREFLAKFGGPPARPDRLYQCGAGITAFHVDALGCLSPCLMIRAPSYELRTGTFRQGWRESIPEIVAQKWSEDVPCRACELFGLCGQCPGFAQMECGDPQAPVSYLCHMAHLRAQAFSCYHNESEVRHG